MKSNADEMPERGMMEPGLWFTRNGPTLERAAPKI